MNENLISIQKKFDSIYQINGWTYGSGEGSLLAHNVPYMNFIESFIQENKINTILDFGCGDWQFSSAIRWGDIQYFGYDIVPSIIDKNIERYGCGKFIFKLFDGDYSNLPQADLFICKDVLQHWSNQDIQNFLPILQNYPFSLVTNCSEVFPGELYYGCAQNQDVANGDFRKLDLQKPPFNQEGKVVFSYTNNTVISNHTIEWFKKTLLITNNL